MIYELLYEGYNVGLFDTLNDVTHRVAYLPKGRYTVREWMKEGEYLVFYPDKNRVFDLDN